MKKVAVMDSGVGGLSILYILMKAFPFGVEFIYISDCQNMPYGNKSKIKIREFCFHNIKLAEKTGADCIVVACNTMAETGADVFYNYTDIPVFFVRPDIDSLITLGLRNCRLFCTEKTAESEPIRRLSNICSDFVVPMKYLASDIEKNVFNLSNYTLNIDANIPLDIPYIFLGCTHYILIQNKFREIFKNAHFFYGYEKIMTKLGNFLDQFEKSNIKSSKSFIGSGNLRIEKVFKQFLKNDKNSLPGYNIIKN